jgi:DNA-binding NarL/FixJ family response regulator
VLKDFAGFVKTASPNLARPMKASSKTAFIAAAPGPLMDGLKGLLMTISQIEEIEPISDFPALIGLVAERHPSLVVLDFDLVANEITDLFEQCRIQSPKTRYIILVDTVDEKRIAEMARTATVLIKGSSPPELSAAVEMLLQPERRERLVD